MNCPQCDSANVMFSKKRNVHICEDCGHEFTLVKTVIPLRIFLSYGHDDNEELVRRIKADLEARGHDVWFDKSPEEGKGIRAGDDWRRAITEGIAKCQKFVSFLSKHSTRDPGVCRDEIAIAIGVKGGNIQTILVESEQEVQAPVNIGHIQWLDMHDWKVQRAAGAAEWEQWYQAKFTEILRVVESEESRRFAGEIEKLNEHLKPIKSEARICQLLSKGFYGRQWLFDAVEKWRHDANNTSRLFWIMGDPGVGKSAFAAQLTHTRSDAVIAAQFVEWDKPDHRDARSVIRSIVFQLATRLPDYRKLLLTLPEIGDLDRKNADELFSYLLANPLRPAIDGGREKHIIVIDALDEAGESGRNTLVEMLARQAPRLPNWLGIVVTSRPESDVKSPLQGLNPSVLDTRTEANRADLRDYLHQKLASQLTDRPDADRLVEQILDNSEGVFLYVERFCDEVQQNHLSLDRPEQFPHGLGGIFCEWFQRQFPDLEKFRQDVRPALRAILAAREPLPVEILQRLFRWQDEELHDFTRTLGSLFPVTKEANGQVIKPYHKSLADWLSDQAKAGAYFISTTEGHRILADYGWDEHLRSGGGISAYSLSHLPVHLAEVHRNQDLSALLANPGFVQAKCIAGLVGALVDDYELLGNTPLRAVGRALQLCTQILTQFPAQLCSQLIGRLAADEQPSIKEFLTALVRDTEGPWLAPRVATLTGPDGGIINSWRAFENAPCARLIISPDEEVVAVVAHQEISFWDVRTGSYLTCEVGKKHFNNFQPELLLDGVPKGVVAPYLERGPWEYKTRNGKLLLRCRVEQSSGYPYNNPRFHGGVFLSDSLSANEDKALQGSYVWGTFCLTHGLLTGTVADNGRSVVCAGMCGDVRGWEVSSRQQQFEGRLGRDPIVAICQFPHAPMFAALTLTGMILIGSPDRRTKDAQAFASGSATLHGLWLRCGGAEAVLLDGETVLTLWNTATGELLYRESVVGEASLKSCCFTPDLRFAFVQGMNRDMYDGAMLAVHDLEKRKCIFSEESYRKRPWDVLVFRAGEALFAEVANLEFSADSTSNHALRKRLINLKSGLLRDGEMPHEARSVPLLDGKTFPHDMSSRVAEDGVTFRLPIQRSATVAATFTAESKIRLAVASSDSQIVVLACDSGQLHFLDVKSGSAPTNQQSE